MSKEIEDRLRTAYLRNGGSETIFETIKGDLVADYRKQATIKAALEEGDKPISMNELMRLELQHVQSRNDDRLRRFVQKGNTNDAA